ncbi:MAG: hypothetical protein ABIJ56_20310 [Pseudomonadota bacterium]
MNKEDYTIEDLRAVKATTDAIDLLRDFDPPDSPKERAKIKRKVVRKIAAMLGETHADTLENYIHLATWLMLDQRHAKTGPRSEKQKNKFAVAFLNRVTETD